MSWRPSFIARLAKDQFRPVFQVRGIDRIFTAKPAGNFSARAADSGFNNLIAAVEVPGEAVEPLTWNPTHEAWTFEVQTPSLVNVLPAFGRGKLVQLFFGEVDQPEADYEPLAVGIVEQIENLGGNRWRWSVGGLGTLLGSRLDGGLTEQELFYDLPASSTLSAGFTAGSDATLNITSTTDLVRDSGGQYLVQVEPTTGEAFYLLGSAKTATTMTIVDNTGSLGTTAVNASSGDTVNFLAYIQGHPCDVTRKILTSTGAGTNGTYDTLPKSWGLAIPEQLIDTYDINAVKAALVPASGALTVALIGAKAEKSPGDWLTSYLQTLGIFITSRQGLITLRYAVRPWQSTQALSASRDPGPWIDPWQPINHVCYDDRYNVEYTQVNVESTYDTATSAGSNETPASTMPSAGIITYTTPVDTNVSANLLEVVTRLSSWALRIPENLRVITAGWYLAQLCPGDVVPLTTALRSGRPDQSAVLFGRFEGRLVMVANVAPACSPGSGFSTALELLILPETAG